jgi:hypothetical protein
MAAAYAAVRKTMMVWDAKVIYDTHDYQSGKPVRSDPVDMLVIDKLVVVVSSALTGWVMSPVWLYNDVRVFEKTLRGLVPPPKPTQPHNFIMK